MELSEPEERCDSDGDSGYETKRTLSIELFGPIFPYINKTTSHVL